MRISRKGCSSSNLGVLARNPVTGECLSVLAYQAEMPAPAAAGLPQTSGGAREAVRVSVENSQPRDQEDEESADRPESRTRLPVSIVAGQLPPRKAS
ncbi:hypothetical protein RRG08_056823 [Elysia crispata]|uniref:Uncharacterized protein n=1 Tax=Elysia crispata TaxID=231223 RepID=A0AAE1ABI7_9GAST|nr:hypothetical protein RRG08_056823 [Elysia crispata]